MFHNQGEIPNLVPPRKFSFLGSSNLNIFFSRTQGRAHVNWSLASPGQLIFVCICVCIFFVNISFPSLPLLSSFDPKPALLGGINLHVSPNTRIISPQTQAPSPDRSVPDEAFFLTTIGDNRGPFSPATRHSPGMLFPLMSTIQPPPPQNSTQIVLTVSVPTQHRTQSSSKARTFDLSI